MTVLALPIPPSANEYYKHTGRVYKSSKAKAYQTELAYRLNTLAPIEGDIQVEIVVNLHAKRRDVDNTLKVLLDALEGLAYKNDRQIRKIVVEKIHDKKFPERCLISIDPYLDYYPSLWTKWADKILNGILKK